MWCGAALLFETAAATTPVAACATIVALFDAFRAGAAFVALPRRAILPLRTLGRRGTFCPLLTLRPFGTVGLFHALNSFKLIASRTNRGIVCRGRRWGRGTRAWRLGSGRRGRVAGRTRVWCVEIWIGIPELFGGLR